MVNMCYTCYRLYFHFKLSMQCNVEFNLGAFNMGNFPFCISIISKRNSGNNGSTELYSLKSNFVATNIRHVN